jgi:hypothetical protein
VEERAILSRTGRALLALIILGGALLRLRYLGGPMRYDEAFTFDAYALSGIGHITSTYDIPNNHILYSLLAHFSWQIFGDHVWTVRLPAFLAGVALIPMTYLVARRLYNPRAALCAAALTAAVGPLVEFSVNGRGYTLAALLMLICLWLATELLHRASLRLWAAFVVCAVVAVYTVPTTAYGIAVVAVWMTMCALRSPRQLRLVGELAIASILAAGLSLLLYSRVLGQPGWTAVTPVPVEWTPIKNLVSTVWENWNSDTPHPVDWIVAASFLTATALHRRIAQHAVPVVAAAVVALFGIVLVGKLPPYSRNWLFLLPLYLIPAGAGLAWLTTRVRVNNVPDGVVPAVATAAVALAIGLTTLSSELRNSETPPTSDNDIVGLLRRFVPPNQKAAVDPVYVAVPLAYYFRRFGGGDLASNAIGPAERRSGHVILVVARNVAPDLALRFFKATPAGPARRLFHNYIDIYDAPIDH